VYIYTIEEFWITGRKQIFCFSFSVTVTGAAAEIFFSPPVTTLFTHVRGGSPRGGLTRRPWVQMKLLGTNESHGKNRKIRDKGPWEKTEKSAIRVHGKNRKIRE